MTRRLRALALAIALLAVPAPALALPTAGTLANEALPTGGGSFTLGLQGTSGYGALGTFRTALLMDGFEMGAMIAAPPGNILGFFSGDAYIAFMGQTGAFLPVNLMPVMGFGGAMNFLDLPPAAAGGSTKTDINMWLYMPVGLRYAFKFGSLTLGAEALYHMPAIWISKGQSDPSRWHFGLQARSGKLFGEVFQETGALYNGLGARAGLVF